MRNTLISRFILTSPSAPLSWFSLSSMVSGHHQMDHEVARGRGNALNHELLLRDARVASVADLPVDWTTPESRHAVIPQKAVI